MRLAPALVLPLLFACVPARVVRVDPRSTVDLSGHWNDADANQVADTLVADCLANGWVDRFTGAHPGATPVVRLYPVRNRSDDHLNARFFTKQVEASLLRTGRIRIVADPEEAADPRAERRDQGLFASVPTVKPEHRETGSDYVLNGWVVGQDDRTEDLDVRAWLVTLELSDVTTNDKVWIGTRQIKKLVPHG